MTCWRAAAGDVIHGGSGEDTMSGGTGRDFLTGGANADVFVFASTPDAGKDALRNQILDLVSGLDLIDVSDMAPGAFDFRGTGVFTSTGSAEPRQIETPTGSTIVQFDVEGTGTIDAEIRVANSIGLTTADFVL